MTMTSPWFYSLLYNGSYMLPQHHPLRWWSSRLLYQPAEEVFHGGADLIAGLMLST